jgi:hypothetical protein
VSDNEELDQSSFAWVAARAACTLPTVFATLRSDVGQDVGTRNAIRPKNAAYEFVIEEKPNLFSVVLVAKDFSRAISFQLEDHAILVLDHSGNQLFEVTLNFNDQGKCRMKAKEEYREPWQVRRMALEDLLFRLV